MSASDGTSFECEGVAPSGKQRPGEGKPIAGKKFAAFVPIIIAFVFSAGVGYFVAGPFVVTQTMGNPGIAARAHGDSFHHKAAFMPMQLSRQAVQPSHRVSEFPARMSPIAMNRFGDLGFTKPRAPFVFYLASRRDDIRDELRKTRNISKVPKGMITKTVQDEWRTLSAEAKKIFEDQAAEYNKRFEPNNDAEGNYNDAEGY